VQNEKGLMIVKVGSDYGGEFEKKGFEQLFIENGISHNFSCLVGRMEL
jgi:hypothetical protein